LAKEQKFVAFEFASFPQKFRSKFDEIRIPKSCKCVVEDPNGKRDYTEWEKLPFRHPVLSGKFPGKFPGKPFEIPGSLEGPSLSKIYAERRPGIPMGIPRNL
jgi:hypothetical protein